MSRKRISVKGLALIVMFLIIPICASSDERVGSAPVSGTGQDTCYDHVGNSTNCTSTGQDGEHQRGITWPDSRFTDHKNGTVTDNSTGLIWTKNTQQIKGTMEWSDALTACNNLDFAGCTDWRLPNVKELLSIIDYEEHDPALPSLHPFNNVQFIFYWSSTTYDAIPNHAWGVYVCNGYAYNYHKVTDAYVWPVRGGE